MKQHWSTSLMMLGLLPITRTPWKQMILIPGMSRPHFFIESITFFSASSPNTLFGSLLSSKVGGARTTFEVFNFSVKNSTTESPEEASGVATAGLWTDRDIFQPKVKSGVSFSFWNVKAKKYIDQTYFSSCIHLNKDNDKYNPRALWHLRHWF